jgi:queuosine precursor transporter
MRTRIGVAALAVYVLSIPLANWFIQHVGEQPFPGGPHTIPVGFGYDAPSGVLWIGVALVARDVVQRFMGRHVAVLAILVGAGLSYLVAPSFAWASCVAFGLGELADFAVYTPLSERRLYLAVIASGIVGAVVDSLIFLQLAFGSTLFWQGNVLGKVWMSVLALPIVWAVRRAVPRYVAV